MSSRRQGSDNNESLTLGGFLDSIIARRQSGDKVKAPDHMANRTRIKAWFESLPLTEPMPAKDAAFQLLLEQDSLRLPFSAERTEALLYLDRDMHPHLLRLESDYLAAKPGGELETVLARACSELGRAFIVTFERAFTDNLERLGSRAALNTLALILSRIVHYLAWQARLCAYKHTDWIPGRWQQLHRIYRKARAFNVQKADVPDLSDPNRQRKTTIEAEYLSLLLMWRLNSGTLSRTELAQAYYWLRDRPREMTFVPTQRPGTRLGLDPTQPEGMKPVAHLGGATELLLYDSSVLSAQLSATLKRLQDRQKTPINDTDSRRLRQQIELVSYLIAHWVVNGFTERAARQEIDRRVEVIGGWNEIANGLRTLNTAQVNPSIVRLDHRLPGAVATGAAATNSSGIQLNWSMDQRGAGLWIVRDESASGSRIVSPAGKGASLRVGDAVAMHDPLTNQWDVALVRRWKLAGEDRIELGLMWLGRNAKPLRLYEVQGVSGERAPKVIDAIGGEPVGSQGERLMVLLPAAACANRDTVFERDAGRGKTILQLQNVDLPGLDWCWATLRVVRNEPGIAGEHKAAPPMEQITEIEITAPRD
ncbi:MAG: hypothetical protein ABIS68_06760 [Casimicrobiaceae bacterium]